MKSIYKKLFIKLLTVCAFCFALTISSYAESIDDLKVDKYVNDYANIIDDVAESEINNLLYNNYASTTNQIIVVTVNNLGGDYIENYSIKLAEKIRAGDEKNDNGVLLLVAKDDRKLRIEVGYGLEGYLTDLKSRTIIDEHITPKFKNGDYTAGITNGVEQIILATNDANYKIAGESYGTLKAFAKVPAEVFIFLFFIIVSLFQWLVAVLARTKSWWLGGLLGFVISAIVFFFIFKSLFVFLLALFGFAFDYLVSKNYKQHAGGGKSGPPDWWAGGATFGGGSSTWTSSSSGGFSGGGGSFGGGGSSGSW